MKETWEQVEDEDEWLTVLLEIVADSGGNGWGRLFNGLKRKRSEAGPIAPIPTTIALLGTYDVVDVPCCEGVGGGSGNAARLKKIWSQKVDASGNFLQRYAGQDGFFGVRKATAQSKLPFVVQCKRPWQTKQQAH